MSTKASVFGALALPRRSAGWDMGYVLDCYGPCSEACSCSLEPHHTTALSHKCLHKQLVISMGSGGL